MNKPKLLIYELNEVPRRLLDYFIKNNPNSAFAKISREGLILNTLTKDDGELHPWSTWPTVHRGIYNTIHNIRYINQDLQSVENFKPIWSLLAQNKIDVGVFGSLQSYPPINSKHFKFYLPDTFSPGPEAIPEELRLFQSFNLELVLTSLFSMIELF